MPEREQAVEFAAMTLATYTDFPDSQERQQHGTFDVIIPILLASTNGKSRGSERTHLDRYR